MDPHSSTWSSGNGTSAEFIKLWEYFMDIIYVYVLRPIWALFFEIRFSPNYKCCSYFVLVCPGHLLGQSWEMFNIEGDTAA